MLLLALISLFALLISVIAQPILEDTNAKYVNPILGTAGAVSIGGYGGTIPSTSTPFAMTHWTAMTQENWVGGCPYIYWQNNFYGFLASHQPAKWMGESGEIAISFGTNKIKTAYNERGIPFKHSAEVSTASYYSLKLQNPEDQSMILAELSGVSRAGIIRLTFDNNQIPYVAIQVTRDGHNGQVTIDPINKVIYGWNPERQDANLGPDKAEHFKGYFYTKFDDSIPFVTYGTAYNDTLTYNVTEGNGALLSAFVQFPLNTQQIILRSGISYISIEQAKRNLEQEISSSMSLEQVSEYTWSQWSEKLDMITLYNATEDQREMFYTAMFHAMQFPNEMYELTEQGYAYYSGYDDQIHLGKAYTSYSIWDTFRAEWAFLNLFVPERINDMITSMLQVYQQSGRLPIWQNIVETNIMISTHSSSLIAESLVKGFHDFNLSVAWEAIYKDAMIPPENDTTTVYSDRQEGVGYEARAGLTTYLTNGWVAAMKTSEAGSRTLEYAYDDYTVGVAAIQTGHADQADYFFTRSKNYRYLWDPVTQFMCARNEDGTWNTDSSTWTEASNWVYTFNVQHDFAGLRDLFGNTEGMYQKLNDYFLDHHNLHPNEPSHATAYAFYYANAPERAQEQLRHILRLNYHAGPFGLSGEDDCGQMSAWYVFNALGFYPVNPASGMYMIGSPIFDRVEIQFPPIPPTTSTSATTATTASSGNSDHNTFTITASGAKDHIYVQRLTLDDIEVTSPMISHQQLMEGKELVFTMSHYPQTWFKDQV